MRMSRPPSTKLGRTSTGNPILRAWCRACCTSTAVPFAGCISGSCSTRAANRFRFSAMSMLSTLVPMIGTPAVSSAFARFSGVCPPNWTITPSGFIRS
jgi:hypothetical protein